MAGLSQAHPLRRLRVSHRGGRCGQPAILLLVHAHRIGVGTSDPAAGQIGVGSGEGYRSVQHGPTSAECGNGDSAENLLDIQWGVPNDEPQSVSGAAANRCEQLNGRPSAARRQTQ